MRAQKTWSTPLVVENKAAVPCPLCGGAAFARHLDCAGFAFVRCRRCNLVQINPQSDRAAVFKRYSGDAYLDYELANEQAFFRLGKLALGDANIAEIEGFAEGAGNKRVLEVGCATGALLEFLAQRGWDAQGVEISERQAEYAASKRGLRVSALPLEENAFPSESFSLALASHLIEHLNNPADFVREIRRVLAPGGRFLVTTPNCAGFQARLFGAKWRSAIFDHLYLFSKKTLSRLLLQEGFAIEKVVTWGGIAEGCAPGGVKKICDRAAKLFGIGDVMMFRAVKR